MKNLFKGKNKRISLLVICVLLIGFVVIVYTSLNKKVTISSTTNGNDKGVSSQTEENKQTSERITSTEERTENVANEDGEVIVLDSDKTENTENSDNGAVAEKEEKKGGSISSNSSSNSNTSQQSSPSTTPSLPSKPSNVGSSKPSHTHNWVKQTKKVHHKEQGHYENVLVKPASIEEVPIYKEKERSICNGCRKDITDDPYKHLEYALMVGNTKCSGFHSEWKKVQVGTKKVHHKAEYKKKWLVDKKAWTETVVTGHKCSGCGQTK